MSSVNRHLVVHPEVASALRSGSPVVALESTIIAHGLPYPANLELGLALEETVRHHGATPATIAMLAGKATIGLTHGQLELLATRPRDFVKASALDLGPVAARGGNAATTVSSTAKLASQAGITVFATGGIGGVHRGDTLDVSHDLITLAQTKIAVVSAGAKAILDLAKTMEYLETHGVVVLGHQCSEFPAFYTAQSGIALEHSYTNVADIASAIAQHWTEFDGKGVLVANPIPRDFALDPDMIDAAISAALAAASQQAIGGKRLTPFLLAKLAEVTGGQSIKANQALAQNNAMVAAQLAVNLAKHGR